MDVIFEGALSRSWSMQDVLGAIMSASDKRFAILRVASPGTGISGRMTVCDGSFIVSATLADGSETGYPAVRRLLMLPDGNFALLDLGAQQPPGFDESLCLSIKKVIGAMPDLPDDPCELFDEKTLLDRVFGGDTEGISQYTPANQLHTLPAVPSGKQAPADEMHGGGDAPQRAAWNFMQPLLGNHTPTSRMFEFDDTCERKTSLNKLRGSKPAAGGPWYAELWKEALLSRQAIIVVALIFAASLVLTLSFLQGRHVSANQDNSTTITTNHAHDQQ